MKTNRKLDILTVCTVCYTNSIHYTINGTVYLRYKTHRSIICIIAIEGIFNIYIDLYYFTIYLLYLISSKLVAKQIKIFKSKTFQIFCQMHWLSQICNRCRNHNYLLILGENWFWLLISFQTNDFAIKIVYYVLDVAEGYFLKGLHS